MPLLAQLYKTQPATITDDVAAFIAKPRDTREEIEELNTILQNPSFEKAEAIFVIEVLAKALKKQQDVSCFITTVLSYVQSNTTYKNSIFILRILNALSATPFFVPITYNVIILLEEAINIKKLSSTGRKYDYDYIRLSSDDLISEELQSFVIKESMRLIRAHCVHFSQSIGFPEYAFVVCSELRNRCKVGVYKSLIASLIKSITDHKELIEKRRDEMKVDALDASTVKKFEESLPGISFDEAYVTMDE